MPFNSLSYFLFLPVVFLVHYFSPDRLRWLVLLVASFVFYAALKAPHLIFVLLLVTTASYFTGIRIEQCENPGSKRCLLWGGITANVLVLVTLKYLAFFTLNLNRLLGFVAPGVTISDNEAVISIGASYFVFQAISYLIDIYLEIEKPEPHFGRFLLYMSFFPKLLQGPIERAGDLLPQLKQPYAFSYDNVRSGMLLFGWGLLQKVVIADRLAFMANQVFDNVHAHKGFPLLLATYYFTLQIFFDFSGYTDMAIGTARMFNITLTKNFNDPYYATSIAEFWRRWHISFSRWILDYIFKPLQMTWRSWGNRGAALALLVTFLVSGLWHGAKWGFVVWGLLHGIYMACSIYYRPVQKKLYRILGIDGKSRLVKVWQAFCVFNIVAFAWIFFRCDSIADSMYVVRNILPGLATTIVTTSIYDVVSGKLNLSLGAGMYDLVIALVFIAAYARVGSNIINVTRYGTVGRYAVYYLLCMSIVLVGFYGKSADFIYFRF
jgi:alginate O-acetyltransferase complex protein AlgI